MTLDSIMELKETEDNKVNYTNEQLREFLVELNEIKKEEKKLKERKSELEGIIRTYMDTEKVSKFSNNLGVTYTKSIKHTGEVDVKKFLDFLDDLSYSNQQKAQLLKAKLTEIKDTFGEKTVKQQDFYTENLQKQYTLRSKKVG